MCDSDSSVSSDTEDFDLNVSSSISTTADVEDSGTRNVTSVLPERSRIRYEVAYENFEKWSEGQNLNNEINEQVLMGYFEEKAKIQKPSSLYTNYSMLRSVIATKHNVDISQFKRLSAFLKKLSTGYQAKKSKILSRQDVSKFLTEAEDDRFLLMKVALIIGIGGGCRRDELTNLLTDNVQDEGNFFRIVIPNPKTKAPEEFFITPGSMEGVNNVEIIRKYVALRPRPIAHSRFFVAYRDGKCTRQPVGCHAFGNMPRIVAAFLKLPNPEEYTGHCFRRLSSAYKR